MLPPSTLRIGFKVMRSWLEILLGSLVEDDRASFSTGSVDFQTDACYITWSYSNIISEKKESSVIITFAASLFARLLFMSLTLASTDLNTTVHNRRHGPTNPIRRITAPGTIPATVSRPAATKPTVFLP